VRGRRDSASLRVISMADAEIAPEDAIFESLERRMINSAAPLPVLILAAWSKLRPETRRRAVNRRGAKDPQLSEKIADILRARPKLTKTAAARIAADEKAAIHELRRDHGMSQAAAEKLVRSQQPRGSGWVQELARQSCDATHKFIEPTNIPACPSRWFKTSRRMFSYWRNKEGEMIGSLGDDLLDLVYSSTLDKFAA